MFWPLQSSSEFSGVPKDFKFSLLGVRVSSSHLPQSGVATGGVLKLSRFGLSRLWELITPSSDLRLGWGLKQTYSFPQELSNGVSHFTCTHRGRVDSRLLVVGSETTSLTPGPSFDHNLCCRCPNGSCEAILDIYTSRNFQQYKDYLNARCFDPCNQVLSFQESRKTPSSHFWECEFHPHTCLKVGLRHLWTCSESVKELGGASQGQLGIPRFKCTHLWAVNNVPRIADLKEVQWGNLKLKCKHI